MRARPIPARLATRSPDDPAIALLDAWSTIGDVLAFYQERIANEGFLRTATERRSILEQARLIGYELHPGVAASAYLAFGVDTAEGSPASAVVPAGTKVQSVPGQNELPQTFEKEDYLSSLTILTLREAELFTGGREVARAIVPFLTRLGLPILYDARHVIQGVRQLVDAGLAWVEDPQDNWRVYKGPSEPIPAEIPDERVATMVR